MGAHALAPFALWEISPCPILLMSKNQKDWDLKLLLFLLTYHSTVHEITGYSPSQVVNFIFFCDLSSSVRSAFIAKGAFVFCRCVLKVFTALLLCTRAEQHGGIGKVKTRYDLQKMRHDFLKNNKVELKKMQKISDNTPF